MIKRYVNIKLSIGSAAFLLLISPLVCEAELLTVLPIESLNEGFFIGNDMRICKVEGCNNKYCAKGLCRKHWSKKYRENNKEDIAEWHKIYSKKNKTKINKYQKKWYSENKEEKLKKCAEYRKNNKEKISKYYRELYQNNRFKILEQTKQYQEIHKEQRAEYHRQYYIDNKEIYSKRNGEYMKQYRNTPTGKLVMKAIDHNRRILKKGLTKETIQRVYEDNINKYGVLTCYLCSKPIINSEDSLEHSIPLSRGGSNNYENLGVAHRRCNSQKGIMTLEEWYEKV